ncbi:ABC transporter substrate-binding protein [Pseudohoeflea coraliihabitans]|uniref:Thiamine pyrimidine synthase n=1 Tax=Pseudohoeflea coraliihabitans TaxID=2860393 RepID=A0ABS6WM69_9HYPH|nr:ABC transporter substrate-binding protein [Pseudohoeflea sp. DP4N28-3]MBW3097044.1 ABC transporter substrate-binding protein [Pseudohoeflea sp. DP4N28-3]
MKLLSKIISAASAAALFGAVSAASAEPLSVRLDFSPWGVHAGMHLAAQKGWFEEAGLDVDVQDGRGSGNTLQLVNSGQVDVGQIQLGLLGSARKQGAEVKSFAGFLRKTDLCVLVDEDSPIEEVADLEGKSVVVFAASPWAPFIDAFLAGGDLTQSDVEVLFVDPSALWGTYTAKRVDGLMSTVSSALPVAKANRPSKCLTLDQADLFFPSYGLIATEQTIEERGDELAKLVEVQQRAWQAIKDDIELGVDAMIAQRPDANLNRDVVREQIQLSIDYFDTAATEGKPIGFQAKSDWEDALKGMERAGIIDSGWNTEDYYTNDLVKE